MPRTIRGLRRPPSLYMLRQNRQTPRLSLKLGVESLALSGASAEAESLWRPAGSCPGICVLKTSSAPESFSRVALSASPVLKQN